MTYIGQVKNGVVVFEGETPPDGTTVRVEPLPESPGSEAPLHAGLLAVAGRAKHLPSDLARNHDHYLHGRPRQ
jgi:hypothetical protein